MAITLAAWLHRLSCTHSQGVRLASCKGPMALTLHKGDRYGQGAAKVKQRKQKTQKRHFGTEGLGWGTHAPIGDNHCDTAW